MGRGTARPIKLYEDGPRSGPAHGVGSDTQAFAVRRPNDLKDRVTGRPMCCPVVKDARIYAKALSRFFFPSGFRAPAASGE